MAGAAPRRGFEPARPSGGDRVRPAVTPGETVDAFMAAINARDLDAATTLLGDRCECDNVPMGKVHGRVDIHQRLVPMMERCSELGWIAHRQTAAGPVVINERLDRFRWPDGWVEMPRVGVVEVHDGRITLWRDDFDFATHRNQLPAPSGEGT